MICTENNLHSITNDSNNINNNNSYNNNDNNDADLAAPWQLWPIKLASPMLFVICKLAAPSHSLYRNKPLPRYPVQ